MKYEIKFSVSISDGELKDAFDEGYESDMEYLEDMFIGYSEDDSPGIEVDKDSLKIKKCRKGRKNETGVKK